MKIAAVIDENWSASGKDKFLDVSFYRKIKDQRNADALIVLTAGEFGQDGTIAKRDKYRKAKLMRNYGADLVLELPIYCTLTALDTFAFAAVSMLEKLNCVNELVVFTEGTKEEFISEIAQFLFVESEEYQNTIKKYCAAGLSFASAQAQAVEHYIPGSGNVLECAVNRAAVEYAKAMKRMYSTMSLCFFECDMGKADGDNVEEISDICKEAVWKDRSGRSLATRFSRTLEAVPELHREKYLNEISGGYAPETRKILSAYRKQNLVNFEQFAELLAEDGREAEETKRYLLRVILGIRQVDISICGLYSYALYVRALGRYGKCPLFAMVKNLSWIPVFSDDGSGGEGEAEAAAQMDDSGRILLEIDRRAKELHRLICRT